MSVFVVFLLFVCLFFAGLLLFVILYYINGLCSDWVMKIFACGY